MLTRAAFAARRTEIDALNVYPVPDGDTGTNLYLTMDGAISHTVDEHADLGVLGRASLVDECRTLAKAVLLSARGNSGVIVSQIIGGLCAVVIEQQAKAIGPALLAEAFERGATMARAAVVHPAEGTILSVADAAARATRAVVDAGADLAGAATAAVEAAREALQRTPEQLPELARAGVVDAGGAGCVLMLEALHRVVTGEWSDASDDLLGAGPALQPRSEWLRGGGAVIVSHGAPQADPIPADMALHEHGDIDGPAFEVIYLVEETSSERVRDLRAQLDRLGDSLVIVGGPELWKVHVHVDEVGAAIERGIEAGRLRGIEVTHFATQVAERAARQAGEVGVVACAAGPGIASLMEEAGAVVVPSGPRNRASAGQLLAAIRETRARKVILLPNDRDTVMAADLATRSAADDGIEAHVVPARAAVQGISALAVYAPGMGLHENVAAMTGAAAGTRHGAVSVAYKEALTWAGMCKVGDVLGIVSGEIALLGDDLATMAVEVLERLLQPGGELVTLVVGDRAEPTLLDSVAGSLRRLHPEIEISVLTGGQAAYPLLIGVE